MENLIITQTVKGCMNQKTKWEKMPHPEYRCDGCGNLNPTWHAPSELWNRITGHPPGLVICPKCFQDIAEKQGIVVEFVAKIL